MVLLLTGVTLEDTGVALDDTGLALLLNGVALDDDTGMILAED